ncbi:MAG: 30S ribosomal protein S6 [bacterium]
MKSYETIVIFNPKLAVEEVDQTVSKIENIITSNGGKVTAVNKWGVKKTEHSTKGHQEGFYVHITFDGPGELVSTLIQQYRVTVPIIKHLTTKVEPAKAPASKESKAAGDAATGKQQ